MTPDIHRPTIVIAEDSPTQASRLKFVLQQHGYHVEAAANGLEAHDLVIRFHPTLVITDIMMPDMDGFALCRLIKSDAQLRSIPVLLLTSLSHVNDVLSGLESGADSFITKPYSEAHLIDHIDQLLALQRVAPQSEFDVTLLISGDERRVRIEPQRMLSLLVSSYQAAIIKNRELVQTQEELLDLNDHLEDLVDERTEALQQLNDVLEARVRERTRELEAANDQLLSFASSVSHDLRAPLRAIDGFTSIVVEKTATMDDPEIRHCGSMISSAVRDMRRLIDDILDFSRSGTVALSAVEVDMDELVTSVLEGLTHDRDASRITVQRSPLPRARGDAAMLRQVWTNILSNALKFSGHRAMAVITISGGIENGRAVYQVQDNGAGFDMAYVDQLFTIFRRLHGQREFEGTGVGLAIVHRIVQRHGGTVWATGEPDHGATFAFALPCPEPDAASPMNP